MTKVVGLKGRRRGERGIQIYLFDGATKANEHLTVHGSSPKELKEAIKFWLSAMQKAEETNGEITVVVKEGKR